MAATAAPGHRKMIMAFALIIVVVVSTMAILDLNHKPAAIPVGVIWYLWYGGPDSKGGPGTPGWNSKSCPGGGSVVDKPYIGYYASDSNQTFRKQIDEMQNAGLSFAVVSWWGPFTRGEAGAINNATLDLFRYLKDTDSSFRIAIMVDAFTTACNLPSLPTTHVYSYIQNNFVNPYGQWYFNWQGKPLVLFFNPLQPGTNDNFTVRTIGNRPNPVDWTFWDAPARYFQGQVGSVNATNDEGQPVISADGEVTLVPRIDSYYNRGYQNGSYLRFDPTLSEGLYQEQWSKVLNHSSNVKLVLVYSWNEYHERTAIEPHLEPTGEPSPLVNYTRSFVGLLGTATAGRFNFSQEITSACAYLVSNYDSSAGLIAETPNHARYFLYSDNFLATLVLQKACNNPRVGESIKGILSRYDSSAIPNQFMAFGCKLNFQGAKNYALSGDIWTTVNNQSGAPLNESYGDIAFLQTVYDVRCGQNSDGLDPFDVGAGLYNGVGFNDTAFRVGESQGVYQTYKLALYIYTSGLLNQTVPLSALAELMAMQAPNGGFYTGYDASLSSGGATTNTETTCLAIMALESVSG